MPQKDKASYNRYQREYKKERRRQDPEWAKSQQPSLDSKYRNHLQRTFGTTPEQYEKQFNKQQGLCAICKSPETALGTNGKVKKLAIDHDHETDALRELLCARCNVGLGAFKDSILVLETALAYLRRHKGTEI